MEYKIIESPDYTDVINVGIVTNPDCPCLKFFLSSLEIEFFSSYIRSINQSISIQAKEWTGLLFYNDMYPEDIIELKMKPGCMYMYNTALKCEFIMNEREFYKIFYDYSLKLIEVNNYNENLPEDWEEKSKQELFILKQKIQDI